MYMLNGISDESVKAIRERMYLILDELGELTYDYHHVRRVAEECVWLATQRGLNINTAETIGLLHDTGRIIGQVSGKAHSNESGKIASIWLKETSIEACDFDTIVQAVSMHNHKKKIGSPYEELIKDADSLAHGIEFTCGLSVHEEIRMKASRQAPLHFNLKPIIEIDRLLLDKIRDLLRTFRNLEPNTISGKEVHALRVNIRSIRSIFGLLRGSRQWDTYQPLNKDLKIIFKSFEASRKLTVFRKSLKVAGIDKKVYKHVTKDIKSENEIALRKLGKYRQRISKFLKDYDAVSFPEQAMISAFNLKVDQYKNSLATSDVNVKDNVHEIRIKGKMIKYLLDNQMVTLNHNKGNSHLTEIMADMELINNLNNCMGKLHDLEENEDLYVQYFDSGKNHLSKKNRAHLKQSYCSGYKCERKQLKVLIFYLRKRCCI